MAIKIRPRQVVADPYTNAIIVEYLAESLSGDKSEMKQFAINTPVLNENTDVVNVAYKLIKQCQYIPEKWLNKVVDVLKEIQFRTVHQTNEVDDSELSRGARISNRLEGNLELLYGTDEDKLLSLVDILSTCKDLQNIALVVSDDPLMSALSRLLSDHLEQKTEVTFNLLKLFLLLADYDDFHQSLSKHRVGLSIMSIIELELNKAEEIRGDIVQYSMKKQQLLLSRANSILYLCCEILLRLSDNSSTMIKMLKKDLAAMILAALPSSSNCTCLLSVLKLLTRASEYAQVVREVESSKSFLSPIVLLVRLISSSNNEIADYSIKVLYNLSFSYNALCQMIDADIIPKLIECPKHQRKASGILYHMSAFDELLSSSKLESLAKLSVEVFQFYAKATVPKDCFALLINMSTEPYFAEGFMSLRGKLIDRLEQFNDRLSAKVLRHLVVWTRKLQISIEVALETRNYDMINMLTIQPSKYVKPVKLDFPGESPTYFNNYRSYKFWDGQIERIALMCTSVDDDDDLLFELIGILNHLTINDMAPSMSWSTICQKYSSLLPLLKRCLIPRMNKADIMVEAVILCNQICSHKDGASLFIQCRMVSSIIHLFDDYEEDSELLLQTILLCETLLPFDDARKELLFDTDLLQLLFGCLNHENPEIESAAERCLDIAENVDNDKCSKLQVFASKIKERRYLTHNSAWLELQYHSDRTHS